MKSLGDMHGYAESRLDHLDHFNLDHPLTIHSSKRCHQHPFHLQVRQQVASVPSKAALTQVVHFLAITSMNPFFQYHVYIYIYILNIMMQKSDTHIWYHQSNCIDFLLYNKNRLTVLTSQYDHWKLPGWPNAPSIIMRNHEPKRTQ